MLDVRDRSSLTSLTPAALIAIHREAANGSPEWDDLDVESAWARWDELALTISREAGRLNSTYAWPETFGPRGAEKALPRIEHVLELAAVHPELDELHEVIILKATASALRDLTASV